MKTQNLQQKNGILLTVNQKVIIHTKKSNKNLTKSIESSLCDYSGVHILVTGDITATLNNAATQVIFKSCAPFKDCNTEINNTLLIIQILLILQYLCTI